MELIVQNVYIFYQKGCTNLGIPQTYKNAIFSIVATLDIKLIFFVCKSNNEKKIHCFDLSFLKSVI